MNNSQLDDLLYEQSRSLPAGELAGQWSARFPDAVSLVPLLELARDIAGLIVPINMRPAFRAELRHNLMVAARQRRAQQALFLLPQGEPPLASLVPDQWLDRVNGWAEYAGHELSEISEGDRRWMVGAAAALSLAGILAYVLHQRTRPVASA